MMKMNRWITMTFSVEGFHCYPNAPDECSYLRARHRHIFVITCRLPVAHNNREIEFNTQTNLVESFLRAEYGWPCEFGALSCEDICQKILDQYKIIDQVEVKEDGYAGAQITRES